MKKLIAILFAVAGLASAQNHTLSSTTLTVPMTIGQAYIQIASAAGLGAGSGSIANPKQIWVDRELLIVQASYNGTSLTVPVTRGSIKSTHASGVAALIGSPAWFYRSDATGACTAATVFVTPWVNILDGNQYLCSAGTWTLQGGGGGSISLTTTGSSGPATYAGGVLNVPQYAGTSSVGACTMTLAGATVTYPNAATGNGSGGPCSLYKITLTGNVTTASPSTNPAGMTTGQLYTFAITQDATGGRTWPGTAWPSTFSNVPTVIIPDKSQTTSYVCTWGGSACVAGLTVTTAPYSLGGGVTFATLTAATSCSSLSGPAYGTVSDSTVDALGSTITGGGSYAVGAFCFAGNWVVSAGVASSGSVGCGGPISAISSYTNVLAGDNYMWVNPAAVTTSIGASAEGLMPQTCTAVSLNINVPGAVGASGALTVTLYDVTLSAATGLTISIPANSTAAVYHSVGVTGAIVANHVYTLHLANAGGSTISNNWFWSLQ
jgi:hypothetical protein